MSQTRAEIHLHQREWRQNIHTQVRNGNLEYIEKYGVWFTCRGCNTLTARAFRKRSYCNRQCQYAHYKRDPTSNPAWDGGVHYDKRSGYRYLYIRGGKRAHRQEHVLVAEKALGRSLRKGEVVHHVNNNKLDNRNNNLLICTQSYHLALHARMARLYAEEHFKD